MQKLQNKIALITGSSRGIGKAIALKFASEGANIAINYNTNYQEAQNVLAEVVKFGVKAITIGADVSKKEDCKRLIETTVEELGGLDILVNNAGGYVNGDDWDGEYTSWLQTFQNNTLAVMNMCKYAIDIFQNNKKGNIINIATRYTIGGAADAPAYAAAKAAIANLTQSYAKLLSPYGRVNAVSPGAVNAGYWINAPKDELEKTLKTIPSHRLIEPEEIAAAVAYLASDDSKGITGQNILIDDGYSL